MSRENNVCEFSLVTRISCKFSPLTLAESISGVIVIGFSVDYTVHLGHMYKEAWDQPTREEKTRYALTHMGATVIGGGLTTGDMTRICLAKKTLFLAASS